MSEEVAETNPQFEYKKPPETPMSVILEKDQDDKDLARYKMKLLGDGQVIVDDKDPRRVLVRTVELMIDGQQPVLLDLSNPEKLKNNDMSLSIKEGSTYRLKFSFHVQREIAAGLHYKHKVKRSGITVEKEKYMMGSYAPKMEIQSYSSPLEDAPTGMVHRGKYKVHSQITDDDGNEYLDWQWTLHITK